MTAVLARGSVSACAPSDPRSRAIHWLRNLVWVVVISGGVGLMLSILEPTVYGLIENLVYSECIGLCMYIGITGLQRWTGGYGSHLAFRHYLVRGFVAVPLGLFAGLNLAALLRGNPTGLAVINHAAIFALPITVVTSAGITYYLWSRRRLADAATAHAEAERLAAEARLKMLQAQIEPHMLFNTLANLRTLVDVDAPRAQAMIDQLIVYLRGTLAASRSSMTTLEAEVAQLGAYLALMQVRMAHRLVFVLDLPDALRSAPIPPMLLQPLVENAIRHGLEPKIEGGTIRVSASSSASDLTIDVVDNGIGLDPHPAEPGYGLEHVRERLRTLYGAGAALAIEARAGGGVRARVTVPHGARP